MESLARGVPVIVIANKYGMYHYPIPNTISSNIWRISYSCEDVINELKYFMTNKHKLAKSIDKTSSQIRDDYFIPVNRKNVLEFVGID